MKNIVINNISTSYYVTEDGKCYNNITGKYLKGQINCRNGYLSYYLTMPNGDKTRQYAHRLVAQAFIPNDDKRKTEINHIDGDKTNNCSDNLEWVTPKENQEHALKNELRKYNHVFCFTKSKELVAEYKNCTEASRAAGISKDLILQELNKPVKTLTGNFYWSKENTLGTTKDYKKNCGKAKAVNQYSKDGKYIMTYPSTGIAAKALGVKKGSHVGECCRGKIKTYKGFVWRYVDDIVSTSSES